MKTLVNSASNFTFNFMIAAIVSLSALFMMSFTKGANGVKFNTTSYKEAQYQAEYRNKPLMVYIGSNSCMESRKQEDVFKMKEVSLLLNNNFYCNKLNTEGFSGFVKAQVSWNVTTYPTILFFSPNGKLIMKSSGYKNKTQLLEMVADAQNQINEYMNKKSGKTEASEVVASK